MSTKTPKPEDEYSSDFHAKRWDNARKIMEEAKGTEMYPRRQLEHEMALLHYQVATMREERVKDRQQVIELRESNNQLIATVEAWQAFADQLPTRLQLLEGAYSGLSMMAAAGLPTKKLIDAYETGLQRGADRALTQTPKAE